MKNEMNNKNYGYARCSTNESKQDINRQRRELIALGVDEENIYWEYESGSKNDRIEFNKLMNTIESGSTLYATEVSRLTRSTSYLCEIVRMVEEKKIRLVVGSLIVDCRNETPDPFSIGILKLIGVFSEMEKDIIRSRVISGMQNAKAQGKEIGRPKTTKDNLPPIFLKYYPKFLSGEINYTEYMKLTNLSRNTIKKYIAIAKS